MSFLANIHECRSLEKRRKVENQFMSVSLMAKKSSRKMLTRMVMMIAVERMMSLEGCSSNHNRRQLDGHLISLLLSQM